MSRTEQILDPGREELEKEISGPPEVVDAVPLEESGELAEESDSLKGIAVEKRTGQIGEAVEHSTLSAIVEGGMEAGHERRQRWIKGFKEASFAGVSIGGIQERLGAMVEDKKTEAGRMVDGALGTGAIAEEVFNRAKAAVAEKLGLGIENKKAGLRDRIDAIIDNAKGKIIAKAAGGVAWQAEHIVGRKDLVNNRALFELKKEIRKDNEDWGGNEYMKDQDMRVGQNLINFGSEARNLSNGARQTVEELRETRIDPDKKMVKSELGLFGGEIKTLNRENIAVPRPLPDSSEASRIHRPRKMAGERTFEKKLLSKSKTGKIGEAVKNPRLNAIKELGIEEGRKKRKGLFNWIRRRGLFGMTIGGAEKGLKNKIADKKASIGRKVDFALGVPEMAKDAARRVMEKLRGRVEKKKSGLKDRLTVIKDNAARKLAGYGARGVTWQAKKFGLADLIDPDVFEQLTGGGKISSREGKPAEKIDWGLDVVKGLRDLARLKSENMGGEEYLEAKRRFMQALREVAPA